MSATQFASQLRSSLAHASHSDETTIDDEFLRTLLGPRADCDAPQVDLSSPRAAIVRGDPASLATGMAAPTPRPARESCCLDPSASMPPLPGKLPLWRPAHDTSLNAWKDSEELAESEQCCSATESQRRWRQRHKDRLYNNERLYSDLADWAWWLAEQHRTLLCAVSTAPTLGADALRGRSQLIADTRRQLDLWEGHLGFLRRNGEAHFKNNEPCRKKRIREKKMTDPETPRLAVSQSGNAGSALSQPVTGPSAMSQPAVGRPAGIPSAYQSRHDLIARSLQQVVALQKRVDDLTGKLEQAMQLIRRLVQQRHAQQKVSTELSQPSLLPQPPAAPVGNASNNAALCSLNMVRRPVSRPGLLRQTGWSNVPPQRATDLGYSTDGSPPICLHDLAGGPHTKSAHQACWPGEQSDLAGWALNSQGTASIHESACQSVVSPPATVKSAHGGVNWGSVSAAQPFELSWTPDGQLVKSG